MKFLIILLFLFSYRLSAQIITIEGKVMDEKGEPMAGANLIIDELPGFGTAADTNGNFTLTGSIQSGYTLRISYIGYNEKEIILSDNSLITPLHVTLQPKVLPSQTIFVEASVGKEGTTPLTYEKINSREIEENYIVQDIPQFLSSLPSATFYSEGGNGIGYNYLSIRGFDQRRISVSINGIPQNEPEDHNVYWLDFPDLLSSTELIQVQRGAGSGVFGYPAIGGSINIITSVFSRRPGVTASASLGSYNTRKYLASFTSGLIDDKYSVYAKLSQILSSGYRNNSWVKFNSYHVSAVRYDDNLTTQLNFYGGPVSDGLAYTGLPKFSIKDKKLRRENYSYWEADENGYTYTTLRRPVEIENFSQPHYELLNEFKPSRDLTFNSALFLIEGDGFFDFDGSWADTNYLRLTSEFGFNTLQNPGNVLIRAMVENTQFGWIPRMSLKHKGGEFIAGGELRFHRSNHWGAVNYGENLPQGLTKDYFYYFYNGSKDIYTAFVHDSYNLNEQINILGEFQAAYHKYRIYNEKFVGTDFSVDDLFFNPRFGINYRINQNQNIYFSFARVSREPRLKDYYDAAESSGGAMPQFQLKSDGSFDFTSPQVRPEIMNDLELGTSFIHPDFDITLNLFYMIFDNEIVKNGTVDRFGQPITGNAENTLHRGIELSGRISLFDFLQLFANATYSLNTIEEGSAFVGYSDPVTSGDAVAELDLSGNRISGFPDFLANAGLNIKYEGLYVQLFLKYVGAFYSDNYDDNLSEYLARYPGFTDYNDNKNEEYFTADLLGSYELNLFNAHNPSKIFLQINNIFDNLYSAYAIGKEFFPAAERNIIAGIEVGL